MKFYFLLINVLKVNYCQFFHLYWNFIISSQWSTTKVACLVSPCPNVPHTQVHFLDEQEQSLTILHVSKPAVLNKHEKKRSMFKIFFNIYEKIEVHLNNIPSLNIFHFHKFWPTQGQTNGLLWCHPLFVKNISLAQHIFQAK